MRFDMMIAHTLAVLGETLMIGHLLSRISAAYRIMTILWLTRVVSGATLLMSGIDGMVESIGCRAQGIGAVADGHACLTCSNCFAASAGSFHRMAVAAPMRRNAWHRHLRTHARFVVRQSTR
jgi:hypothetical protein